jgi:hypothetical protein
VRVTVGPCAGHIGVVTGVKAHPSKADVTIGEFRVEFAPPIHLPAIGALNAVWRRPADFEVVGK